MLLFLVYLLWSQKISFVTNEPFPLFSLLEKGCWRNDRKKKKKKKKICKYYWYALYSVQLPVISFLLLSLILQGQLVTYAVYLHQGYSSVLWKLCENQMQQDRLELQLNVWPLEMSVHFSFCMGTWISEPLLVITVTVFGVAVLFNKEYQTKKNHWNTSAFASMREKREAKSAFWFHISNTMLKLCFSLLLPHFSWKTEK